MERVEMTERQGLQWQAESLSLGQQSPRARVAPRRGGVVTRMKDGCHTEPELKVGQFSESMGSERVSKWHPSLQSDMFKELFSGCFSLGRVSQMDDMQEMFGVPPCCQFK